MLDQDQLASDLLTTRIGRGIYLIQHDKSYADLFSELLKIFTCP